QGGSGTVFYRISEPVSSQGILVGTRFFSGCPVPDRQGVYQALFALPLDAADTGLEVQVQDPAGNRAQAHFPYEIKLKKFRSDTIALTDSFLQSLGARAQIFSPEFFYSASQLNTFIAVNTVLRSRNEEEFRRICSKVSSKKLWQGVFISLPRASTRAIFGDQRSYVQNKKEISRSVHLGLDLASLDQAAVPAANAGRVAEIKQMGIYGLTLILDHGQGLFSTYSHLSAAVVKKGDLVRAGETIAHTGSTGLALGDHLHFGIAIQGFFVNPEEWIDPHWIEQKIKLPLAEAGMQ
ncbi:MAG: M23 family metallopeptidase, partial [Deltaproteobacteria bacterium]|nr:M23 family metallopeptidase [Deltaproteobacteria bacterium]